MQEEDVAAAQALLPAWFVPRMMQEDWVYGFIMVYGSIIAVERVEAVRQAADGSLWLDVRLAPADDYWSGHYDPSVFGAPSTRRSASINCSHVAAAFELVDHIEHNHST
ncbi:MAG: hypothetical protein AB7U81_12375 [Thiohalomonadaceae bacterium]